MAFIRFENIRKTYRRGHVAVPVLKGVSLTVAEGEMVALMGASGSGKTTLINILGTLDRPTEGRYQLDGQEITDLPVPSRARLRGRKIGFVFQNFNLVPRLSALENVLLPLSYDPAGPDEREGRVRAQSLLERVGLGDRVDHEPARLSGGEQQRVAIARALVNRCRLLIADEPTGNLDSTTGREILALFRRLNLEDGLTIVIVTHDPTVAAQADRIVQLRDGLVVSDTPSPVEGAAGAVRRLPQAQPPTAGRHRSSLSDTIASTRLALRSLRRNGLRSALTTLGIVIGVASLVAIAEVGRGSWRSIRATLTKMGVENLLVQAGAASRNGVSLGSGSVRTLTPEDADAIGRECPSIHSLAPVVHGRAQVVRGNRNWVPTDFVGTTPGFLRVRDWEQMADGEPIREQDVEEAATVCLLGNTVARELFPEESPVGSEVLVNDVPLRVIGVLRAKGADIIGDDQDDLVVVPWTTLRFRVSSGASAPAKTDESDPAERISMMRRRYVRSEASAFPEVSPLQRVDSPTLERHANIDAILVRVASLDELPQAMADIRRLLRERHRIAAGEAEDFSVRDFTEVITAVRATVGLVAGMLLCVSLISLVVSGVGIMNIMLVSVTERYREIGLRMAVGARPADILRQFLVEAIVLCLLGGAVGIILGRTSSILVRVLAQWPTEASLWATAAGVAVSVTVGIVFGYYPAWRAASLDPIEALRYE